MAQAVEYRLEDDELVGQSACMQELYQQVQQVAPCDVNVLLQGESGTGKEVVARTIHRLSNRSDGPFIAVNCTAIHETLLESELFGHEAGAFTGARHATLGFLRAADGGTILLDEIGDMSEPLQSSLLRVLEERTVVPVGGTREIPIDIRVIAASHRNLAESVQEGTFREDLFYRLNVVCLAIPPLRARRDDIPLLTEHMLTDIAAVLNMEVKSVSPATMEIMMRYDWPGNVRQLHNALQRAYVLGRGRVIEVQDLPRELLGHPKSGGSSFLPLRGAIRCHVEQALTLSDGKRSQAARLLGIDRKSLWRIMRRYNIT